MPGERASAELVNTSDMMRETSSYHDYAILAGILMLATAFRAVGLNAPLWFDEIATLTSHVRLPWSDMMTAYSMNHHYLFSFQAKLAVELLGEAPWILRLPAAVFGVASIAAMWWLARDIAGSRVAHVTSLLVALSYHHIWFSQNARGYTELGFWSVLGILFFLKGLRNPGTYIWAGFSIVLALAVFTHLTGVFLFMAIGVVWVIWLAQQAISGARIRASKVFGPAAGFAAGLGLSLVLYIPILPSVLDASMTVASSSAVDVMQEYQNPIWTVLEGIRTLFGQANPLVYSVGAAIAGVVLVGVVSLHSKEPLFAPVVLAHILLTIAILLAIGMRIWPRFFFVDIAPIMLLIVSGVARLCEVFSRGAERSLVASRLFAVAAAMMVVVSIGLAARNYTMPKQDLEGAWAYVEAERSPDEPVHALGVGGPVLKGYYAPDWNSVTENTELERLLAQPGQAWLVIAFPTRTFRSMPALNSAVETDFELRRAFPGSLGDGAVLVYARKAS